MEAAGGELYHRQMVEMLQAIWGEGFLGLSILDLGCGAGGRFIASDWLLGHDGAPSAQMAAYIAAEGLDFGMASAARYQDAMRSAGLVDVSTTSRNSWYRDAAKQELERLRGTLGTAAARIVGQDFVDQNIAIWSRMIPVLDSGEHCPTHLRARKPH